MNSVWNVFGNKITLSDEYILEFYLDIAKTSWIDKIYDIISPYLTVDSNNKIHISKTYKSDNDDKNKKELKIKYIQRKMITSKIMLESLLNFEDYLKENFKNINNFQQLIFKYFVDHIMEKIKYSH